MGIALADGLKLVLVHVLMLLLAFYQPLRTLITETGE